MRFEEIAIADGEILQLYWQMDNLVLEFQNWQEVIYVIEFKEICKVIALDFFNEPLDKIVITQSDNFANYQFFGAWQNECLLDITANQDYEICNSTENFQKIAKTGSRERGLAVVKKLQQIHGDN